MTDPAIRAALDAAASAMAEHKCGGKLCAGCWCRQDAAAAIAAFLRSLPDRDLMSTRISLSFPGTLQELAAAVEEAARDE
jgi:hypothetical protein